MINWLSHLFRRPPPSVQPPPEPARTARPNSRRTAEAAAAPPAAINAFRLVTTQGRHLGVVPGTGGISRAASLETPDPAHGLIALVPPGLPSACLLIAADAGPFSIAGDTAAGHAASGRLLQTNVRGVARLKYPLGDQGFLAAAEPPGDALVFDDEGRTMQAAFTFLPLPDSELTAAAAAFAAGFGAALAGGLGASGLLAGLSIGTIVPELAGALVRLLGQDELAEFSRHLLQDGGHFSQLRQAIPHDPWLNATLPALVAWHAGGRPPVAANTLVSPPEDEAPLLPVIGTAPVPAGLALHALARRHVLPRRTACLLATARNEGPYLLDWISYHLSIGFEHIFLYTNENDDGSDALLEALAASGVITVVHNPRGPSSGAQQKAYAHALTMLPQTLDFRWTAILDLDEYLGFDTDMFASVTEFLLFHEAQPVDAVALCWKIFAGMPGEVWHDEATPARFTRRVRDIDKHVKTLFRPREFWSSHPHFPNPTLGAPFHFRTEDGQLHRRASLAGPEPAWAEHPSANLAWVNHYLLKTAEEALWKWSRGRADWTGNEIAGETPRFLTFVSEKFLDLARPEQLVEDVRMRACMHRQGALLSSLTSLPGVAEADASIKAGFRAQLAARKAAFIASVDDADCSVPLRHFRDLVRMDHA